MSCSVVEVVGCRQEPEDAREEQGVQLKQQGILDFRVWTVQHTTARCSTVQNSTVRFSSVRFSSVLAFDHINPGRCVLRKNGQCPDEKPNNPGSSLELLARAEGR